MHLGQHGEADPGLMAGTRRSTPEEYAPLKKELEGLGYHLKLRHRFHPRDYYLRDHLIHLNHCIKEALHAQDNED